MLRLSRSAWRWAAWTRRSAIDPANGSALATAVRRQNARPTKSACCRPPAYVVCAYLTGMRDCEVQAMRSGCLSLTRSEDGIIDASPGPFGRLQEQVQPWRARRLDHDRARRRGGRGAGAALRSRRRRPRYRYALAGAVAKERHQGSTSPPRSSASSTSTATTSTLCSGRAERPVIPAGPDDVHLAASPPASSGAPSPGTSPTGHSARSPA